MKTRNKIVPNLENFIHFNLFSFNIYGAEMKFQISRLNNSYKIIILKYFDKMYYNKYFRNKRYFFHTYLLHCFKSLTMNFVFKIK